MNLLRNHRYFLPLCLPVLLLTAGCSSEPPRYIVTGHVLLNGKPLTVQPVLGQVKVQFLPFASDRSKLVDPNDAAYDQKTGKFTVAGLDGKGIKPGQYRVAIYQYDPYPQTDKLGGKFSKKNTPITVEVKGAQDFPIELNQYLK